MDNELKQIKKLYGEDMMHFCRSKFPMILEHEGMLLGILVNNLAPTKSIYRDISKRNLEFEFVKWIFSLADMHEEVLPETDKTPFELMEEAGYTLYECHTEEDVQRFRHYYSRGISGGETPVYVPGTIPAAHVGEELCTFDGNRLDRSHVFFAVKKNVDEIQRKNFSLPNREDEYGTSVISIQFTRGRKNALSIKNRYNHTVNNPDATFGNNLEKIVPGLTRSFEKQYGLDIEQDTNEDGKFLTEDLKYYRGDDGKYYRFNMEMDGVHYCSDNIIIDHGIVVRDYAEQKERYVLAEHALFDLKEKKVLFLYPTIINNSDSFINSINAVGKIKRIEVAKNGENRIIIVKYEDDKEVKVEINKDNAIVGYQNDYVKKIDEFFLIFNTELTYLYLKNCEVIGQDCLGSNKVLKDVLLDKVRKVGSTFLSQNQALTRLSMESLEEVGSYTIGANTILSEINMPKLKRVGDYFLTSNQGLKRVSLKSLESVGRCFMFCNESDDFEEIDLPKLKRTGDSFFFRLLKLKKGLSLPELEELGMSSFKKLKEVPFIDFPKVTKIGNEVLKEENSLVSITLPSVIEIGREVLISNTTLKRFEAPMVRKIGVGLLHKNKVLEEFIAPELEDISYMYGQDYVKEIIENARKNRRRYR